MQSSIILGDSKVLTMRKRPKETSLKAKTSRLPFGPVAKKLLYIPEIVDDYNFCMGDVDEFDHLTANNAGFRRVRRGGHKVIEHWILRGVLSNYYLICKRFDQPISEKLRLANQVEFRRRLTLSLFKLGASTSRVPSKRVSYVGPQADIKPP